jgi:hypothetical protein
MFEIGDTIRNVNDGEEYTIDGIRDNRYILVNTWSNTVMFLTYHQLIHEFVVI